MATSSRKVVEHFALKPETQVTYWNELGLFPTTTETLEMIDADSYVTDWIEIAGTALLDEPASFENSSELRAIIGEEIEAAMLGIKSSDDAIADMARRLNPALRQPSDAGRRASASFWCCRASFCLHC